MRRQALFFTTDSARGRPKTEEPSVTRAFFSFYQSKHFFSVFWDMFAADGAGLRVAGEELHCALRRVGRLRVAWKVTFAVQPEGAMGYEV